MKIDLNSHFPHPVLSDGNDDFLSGSFDLQIAEVRESTDGNVELDIAVSLASSEVQALVDDGAANAGAFNFMPNFSNLSGLQSFIYGTCMLFLQIRQ